MSLAALWDAGHAGEPPKDVRLKAGRWTARYEASGILATLDPRAPDRTIEFADAPPDTDLPALALLTDPVEARPRLESAIAEQSPRYRELRIASVEAEVVDKGSRASLLAVTGTR
jgi:hypothetical protein